MIKVRDLTKSFGDLQVLKGVSIDIAEREVVVVIGPSGSGKSTFYAASITLKSRQAAKSR